MAWRNDRALRLLAVGVFIGLIQVTGSIALLACGGGHDAGSHPPATGQE